MFYWELIQRDGTRLEIPPDAVEGIKKQWESGSIHTKNSGIIPVNEIKAFRPTDKKYMDKVLAEGASQAFKEPMYNEDGSIVSKWVKKTVASDKWAKVYSHVGYRNLEESGGTVTVAFKLPVHAIDLTRVDYCSEAEIRQLTAK